MQTHANHCNSSVNQEVAVTVCIDIDLYQNSCYIRVHTSNYISIMETLCHKCAYNKICYVMFYETKVKDKEDKNAPPIFITDRHGQKQKC